MKNDQKIAERAAQALFGGDQASQMLGMKIESCGPGRATVSMRIRPDMVNGHRICHGGLIFALADSAFAFACNTQGRIAMSIENGITYPRPVGPGDVLTAVATEESASYRLGFYRVVVTNQKDETVAIFRGTAYKTSQEHP